MKEEYYYWSPLTGAKLAVLDKWGTLLLNPKKSVERRNIYPDGGFASLDLKNPKRRLYITSNPEMQKVSLDHRSFIRDGRSLRLTSHLKKIMHADLPIQGLLPGRRYRLSFFCRLENVQGEGLVVSLFCGPRKGISPMKRRLNGTIGWFRLVFELKIPEDFPAGQKAVIITLRNAVGDAWIDDLRIEEI